MLSFAYHHVFRFTAFQPAFDDRRVAKSGVSGAYYGTYLKTVSHAIRSSDVLSDLQKRSSFVLELEQIRSAVVPFPREMPELSFLRLVSDFQLKSGEGTHVTLYHVIYS